MSNDAIEKTISPLISVVLATKGNKTVLLNKCIESLGKQTFQQFEIILVYSVYPKELSQLFGDFRIFAIKEEGSTLGAARNLGIRYAKSDIVVFIDDDAEAPPDWLSKIYSTFQQYPSLACLGGAHLTPREESRKNPLRFVEGSFAESQMGETVILDRFAVGKIAGCNVAYRKSVFSKVGPLSERLKSGEDWEFHIRLVENGYHLRFDPKISVWHHRQGLKHAFWNCSRLVPFFMNWNTLRYSRYESFFALFYLSNFLFLFLIVILFISPLAFVTLLSLALIGHFLLTAVRTKTYNRQLVYYPLSILFTLARLMGFYFGLFNQMKSKLHH